jgi:hypothetical protein
VFATDSHLHANIIFAGKAGAYQFRVALMGLSYNGWLLALPVNIGLRWHGLIVANTLAYYDTTKNIAVKSFIVQTPMGAVL